MSATCQSQKLLSSIIRLAATSAPRNTFLVRSPKTIASPRPFTTIIPRQAPGGFSVSFAPDPDEASTDGPAASKPPVKRPKSSEKAKKNGKAVLGTESSKARELPEQYAEPVTIIQHRVAEEIDNTECQGTIVTSDAPVQRQQIEHAAASENGFIAVVQDSRIEPDLNQEPIMADMPTTRFDTSNEPFNTTAAIPEGSKKSGKTNRPKDRNAKAKARKAAELVETKMLATNVGSSLGPDIFQNDKSSAAEDSLPDALLDVSNATSPAMEPREKPPTRTTSSANTAIQNSEFRRTERSESSPRREKTAPALRNKTKGLFKDTSRRPHSDSSPTWKADAAKLDAKSVRSPPTWKREPWQVQKSALQQKFADEGWNPRKKLSPDTIEGIRALHEQYAEKYTTAVLSEQFKVSPEAVRRILKSKWRPSEDKMLERRERWAKRHDRIWDQQAEIGLRPARTKSRKTPEPGEIDSQVEIEELHTPAAGRQTTRMGM